MSTQDKQIETGGCAFPVKSLGFEQHGITIRDYFAAQALAGGMASASKGVRGSSREEFTDSCYAYADAMLLSRNKTPQITGL